MTREVELYGRPWGEKEYLLALQIYFETQGQPRHINMPYVRELARLIGRTDASIVMRLENFASVDPGISGQRRGLNKISPKCRAIFEEWSAKRDHLQSCAEVLRRDAHSSHSKRLMLFEPDPVAIPKAFGKYELLDFIGQGSFGVVHSCIHVDSQHVGALKVLNLKLGDEDVRHRFLREIRALRAVRHPNVIRLHADNLDTERDFPGFVMDLATSSLTDYVNKIANPEGNRPVLPADESIGIIRSMISAIEALHRNSPRIIHRDLNPNNILQLEDGSWVLADFGLAKFLGTAHFTTQFSTRTRHGLGTGYYAAPEQYRDFKRTDERTDIYALGVLLWELLTSVWPPPERSTTGLPDPLAAVFLRATSRDTADRYDDVPAFSKAFEEALQKASPPPAT
jgi:serine/threonine protein kinase